MIDRKKAVLMGLALLIFGWLCGQIDQQDDMWIGMLQYPGSVAGWVLVFIGACVRPTKLPKLQAGVYNDDTGMMEVYRLYEKDPEFNQAVHYIFSMSPDEFRKFVRVIADIRYEADQDALTALAPLLKRRGVK